jgi:thiaminase/transcriptional activator TenA
MSETCTRYRAFLQSLHTAPYAVQAAAFWAMERAYNESWSSLGNLHADYQEFADR